MTGSLHLLILLISYEKSASQLLHRITRTTQVTGEKSRGPFMKTMVEALEIVDHEYQQVPGLITLHDVSYMTVSYTHLTLPTKA